MINVPVGFLSILFTTLLVTDPPYLLRKTFKDGLRIDYIGLGLLTIGLGFLEITLDEGQRQDWFSSNLIVSSLIIAVVCLIAVVFWELRQRDPVVDFHLLRERNFRIATVLMFVLGFVLYGSTAAMPLFLQNLVGYTATQSGLAMSPGGLVIMMMMPIVGALLSRMEPRRLVVFGLITAAAGLFLMSGFNLQIAFRNAVIARSVQSLGLAFLFVPINTVAFYFIARQKLSYATGIINLARNIGGSAGIATITTLVARQQQFHQQILVSHLTPLDSVYQSALNATSSMLVQSGISPADALSKAQGMIYGALQRQATMLAFIDTFRVLGIAFLCMIPLVFLMKKTEPHKGEMMVE